MIKTYSKGQLCKMLAVLAIWCSVVGPSQAADEAWPQRPITLVIPYSPGGSVDSLGRLIGDRLGKKLGQPVVIENRPGAGTTIASNYVVKAKPDGYTLYIGLMNLPSMDKILYPMTTYDGVKDFTYITKLVSFPMIVVARSKGSIKSLSDLVAKAKTKANAVTDSTAGVGSSNHLAAVQFMRAAGVKLLNVPFKGGAPATTAVLAGDVDVSFATPPSVTSLIAAGQLRALSLSTPESSPMFPKIPSSAEAGFPAFNFEVWHGLCGPAGMPAAIVDKLFKVTGEILRDPEVDKKLQALGMQADPSNSVKEFNQFVAGVAKSTKDLALAAKENE